MDKWDKVVPLNVHTLRLNWKNITLWWAFKLNSAPAAAEIWHLEGHMLKVKNKSSYFLPHSMDERIKC
jgi:hypothetical protein